MQVNGAQHILLYHIILYSTHYTVNLRYFNISSFLQSIGAGYIHALSCVFLFCEFCHKGGIS